MTGWRVSVPIENDPEYDNKRLKVSIETKNSTKYFSMTQAEFDDMMYLIDSHRETFVKIPGSNLYVNIDQIIYIYTREEKVGESL